MRPWICALAIAAASSSACATAPAPAAVIGSSIAPPPPTAPAPTPARRVVVSSTSIETLDGLAFDPATAHLPERAHAMLDALAQTLVDDETIRLIDVETFGGEAPVHHRQALADARARAIIDYLTAHGVERARLRPHAFAQPWPGGDETPQFVILWRLPDS